LLTNLQPRQWYNVSVGWSVPHRSLARCIVVIETGSLLVKQFPPLVAVLCFTTYYKYTYTCLNSNCNFNIWFQLALSRPRSKPLLLCMRPQRPRHNLFVIRLLHSPVIDTAHVCLPFPLPIHQTPTDGCISLELTAAFGCVMTLGDSVLPRSVLSHAHG